MSKILLILIMANSLHRESQEFTESDSFVTVRGGYFYLYGQRFRFIGANKTGIPFFPQEQSDTTFKLARDSLGIKVIRTWLTSRIGTAPLDSIDYMLNSARENGIRLIMTLCNVFWIKRVTDSLGIASKEFFSDSVCKQLYKNWVKKVITHTNSLNNIPYKKDPYIFSWELCNEPGNLKPELDTLINWIEEMSSYIANLDSNHLISGGTGAGARHYVYPSQYPVNYFILFNQPQSINFSEFHFYSFPRLGEDTTAFLIDTMIHDAHNILSKPIVLEEFGVKRIGGWDKEYWYKFILDEFYLSDGDGAMFWQFTYRDDLTPYELDIEQGISMHPADSTLRRIVKEWADQLGIEEKLKREKDCFYHLKTVPNPFRWVISISYSVVKAGHIELKIYNVAGQLVKTLVNGEQKAGTYKIEWDGKGTNGKLMPSGIYFVELKVDDKFTKTKKLLFLR